MVRLILTIIITVYPTKLQHRGLSEEILDPGNLKLRGKRI
jgi:hypothetical protein